MSEVAPEMTKDAPNPLQGVIGSVKASEGSGQLYIASSKVISHGEHIDYPGQIDIDGHNVGLIGTSQATWISAGETAMTPGIGLCDALVVEGGERSMLRHNMRATPYTLARQLKIAQTELGEDYRSSSIISRDTTMWREFVAISSRLGVDLSHVRFGKLEVGRRDTYRGWLYQGKEDGTVFMATTDNPQNTPIPIEFRSASEVLV